MSALEKKWWFYLPVVMLATICTRYLLDSVGFPPLGEFGLAHWVVYGLCFGALWRGISFAGWLLVLSVSPSTAGVKSSPST